MSTAASAVTTVDSATTDKPAVETPAFDAANQRTWSSKQREEWNRTGTQPTKADSATATEDKKPAASADSATANQGKTADTAPDSATGKDQKPNLKTKEDTERRIKEILDENKALQRRIESLERGKGTPETRDTKPVSQPVAEEPKAPKALREFLEEWFAKPEHKGKKYEDGVDAWAAAREDFSARQRHKEIDKAIAADRQRQAVEAASKDLATKRAEAEQRYGKDEYAQRVKPAVVALSDETIPFPVRALINDSPVFADLLYVLGEGEALKDLVATAKTNPAAALRKIVLTEQLVQAELAKGNGGKTEAGEKSTDGKARDESGKFVSSDKSAAAASDDKKPRAPAPVADVGGRGVAPGDALQEAAKAGNFRNFEAEMNRRMRAGR